MVLHTMKLRNGVLRYLSSPHAPICTALLQEHWEDSRFSMEVVNPKVFSPLLPVLASRFKLTQIQTQCPRSPRCVAGQFQRARKTRRSAVLRKSLSWHCIRRCVLVATSSWTWDIVPPGGFAGILEISVIQWG